MFADLDKIEFKRMTEADYMGLAGASDEAFVAYTDNETIVLDLGSERGASMCVISNSGAERVFAIKEVF